MGYGGVARGTDLTDLDFSRMDLFRMDLSESILSGASFYRSSL